MVSNTDGIANCSHHRGDISPIASEQPPAMACMPQSDASDIPHRPPLTSQQSNSLPSTPYQHARNLSFHSRSPSPARGSTSPRSTHSESAHIPPSARVPLGACKYETAMANFRRRMPYSIGADLLEDEEEEIKDKLDPEDEKKLTEAIMDLYDRLLPSAESDDRRHQLVRKLEKLFNEQWPGHEIKANVFGSSGNKLCSSDSDVDICITTNFKELERVCLLADVLANHGMERVVCVSHAKVPIVKIWDPELKLACDMNVNNSLALENTRMIRTYVDVDSRVRPLAMCVKHWTKRRVLNDAGTGGTLSSYTWICLIINFLQTRNPPILPSLQARPHPKKTTPDGLVYSFDDDLDTLGTFGWDNKQSVGELFFEFFRYYGYEINYEDYVVSVREGKLIRKDLKGWHFLSNNRLCVEEPFNTSRNLGNTADDTSFRGLHMELRQAFKHVAQGDLAKCCEQYEFPREERRVERPRPQARSIITPFPPNRRGGGGANGSLFHGNGTGSGGGANGTNGVSGSHGANSNGSMNGSTNGSYGGGRGGRYNNGQSRSGLAGGRRTSNTGPRSNHHAFRPLNPTNTSDLSLQAQQQAQYMLHDQLYQQIQLLQAQEAELRMQLHNQALITGRPPPVFLRQPFISFPMLQGQETSGEENSRSRSGTVNHPPLTPSQRQPPISNPTYASVSASGTQGSTTNPPSPSTASTVPDLRRNPRRSSVVNESPKASLRAQSQPARPQNSPSFPNFTHLYTSIPQIHDISYVTKQRPAPEPSEGGEGSGDETTMPPNSLSSNGSHSDSVDENRAQDLLGYYLSPQQLQFYQQHSMLPPLAANMGMLQNGYPSFLSGHPDYRSAESFFSAEESSMRPDQTATSAPMKSSGSQSQPRSASSRPATTADRGGPLIVDGSVRPTEHRPSYGSEYLPVDPYTPGTHYTSTSDENIMNTPASFSDSLSQDFQDPGPFEMEQVPVFKSPFELQKQNNSNVETQQEKPNGQPELLASRLQNFHLSNAEKLAQSHSTSKTSKNTSSQHASGKDTAQSKNQASSNEKSNQASGAQESRQAHQNSKRRTNGADASEKANGVSHSHSQKSKPKGRQDTSHNSSNTNGDSKDHPPKKSSAATNGTTDHNHGGWQTTKKKHRRNAKASADPRNVVITCGPEPLPADESMRKGG
ncbi:PAP/25A-associated [Penicillium argentinense]|uniref:polynucleotide adenylyltransferase n=1 Tax=Penicillium argentinense TaxID=1131581 RepID=A0A9W9EW68_9EURO|nr:PAP/25A-associated [Penicillium argentinense]KAJ5089148.1 PAP/25A-associated [Penicillium argentinense]